jgi:hypothetical protein
MNPMTDLERALRVHFDDHADPTVLDGQLDRIIDRLTSVRQRPGWLIPERWLPMSTISSRIASAPRLPLRLVAVALLLLALAASLLLASGALRRPAPPPFGPAMNGLVAYGDVDGAINVGETASGVSSLIVAGPGNERPIFSPDGTHVAFLRKAGAELRDVIVVRADGSDATKITTEPLAGLDYLGWSPNSTKVIASNSAGQVEVFDSTLSGAPTKLVDGVSVGSGGYNAQTSGLYQPPDGQRVLFVRSGSQPPALMVSDADGSNLQTIVDGARSDRPFAYIGQTQWSPNGSMIAFVGATQDVPEDYVAYVVNADGSSLRPLSKATRPISESNPAWSPDGTRIAVQRWFVDVSAGSQDVRPITVVDVRTGREVEVGAGPTNGSNGFNAWGWSPDGASIFALPDRQMLITDVATGATRTIPWDVASAPAWQRLAP